MYCQLCIFLHQASELYVPHWLTTLKAEAQENRPKQTPHVVIVNRGRRGCRDDGLRIQKLSTYAAETPQLEVMTIDHHLSCNVVMW